MLDGEVPVLEANNYEKYKYQVEMWAKKCGLELNLPNDQPSNIKIKIYKEIKEEVKTEQGVTKLMKVIAKALIGEKEIKTKNEDFTGDLLPMGCILVKMPPKCPQVSSPHTPFLNI